MSHAICGPAEGVRNDTPVEPGRVFASVTRSSFVPNVGSVKIEPAAPMVGSVGLVRGMRSDGELYDVGTGEPAGGCCGGVGDCCGGIGGGWGCVGGCTTAGGFTTAVIPAMLKFPPSNTSLIVCGPAARLAVTLTVVH